MTDFTFPRFRQQIVAGNDIWTAVSVRALLVDSSSGWTPSGSEDTLADALSGGLVEISPSGYVAGGAALGSKSVARADPAVQLKAGPVTWTALAAGPTVIAVVLYVHTGTNSTSDLIAYLTSPGSLALTGANCVLSWPGNVVVSLT
jgi:hypothetical protein